MNSFIVVLGILLLVLLAAVSFWLAVVSTGRRIFRDRPESSGPGTPLFARGNELFLWARDTAAGLVADYLKRAPTDATAASVDNLASELDATTTCGMFPLDSVDEEAVAIPCPRHGQGTIGVSALEAIAIADYLEENLPEPERNRVLSELEKNAREIAAGRSTGGDAGQMPCPLQGSDGICLAYPVRPIHCRALHAAIVWREKGLRRPVDADRDYDERVVAQGVETGVTEALASAGRDGQLYELNCALATVLNTPNAAQRWARGEEILAGCARAS